MALNPYARRPYSEHHAAGTWTTAGYSLPVRGDHDECYKALCSELPVLPTVGLDALVEEACQEDNAQGKTLEKQIHDLVNKQVLGRAGVQGAAFDVIENRLQNVYIFPAEFG